MRAANADGRVRRKLDMKSYASVTVFQENNNRWHTTGIRIINHGEILHRAPQPGLCDSMGWHFSRWKINRNRPDQREGESNLGESLLHGFDRWPSLSGSCPKCLYQIKLYFWAWSMWAGIHHCCYVYTHCTLFLKHCRGVWLTVCRFQPITEL